MFEIILALLGTIAGFVFTFWISLSDRGAAIFKKKQEAQEILVKSKKEAQEIMGNNEKSITERKKTFQHDIDRREARIKKIQDNLNIKGVNLDKRNERIETLKLRLASEEESFQSITENNKRIEKEIFEKLARNAGEKAENLKTKIINGYEKQIIADNEKKLVSLEEDARENAVKIAKKIILNVQQRLTTPTSTESRAVYVPVPKDQIKGKIVGKDGQNIAFFEEMLDVDVVFNELPQTISISSYNLMRRKIAQKTMERLVSHGGEINPEVIEKAHQEAVKEVDKELYNIGKKAITTMGIKEMDPELTRIIGRLKFRTSYGQNILRHSMEVCWIAMMLAYETGLDVEVLRVGSFLHDLGKAIDQDPGVEGTHDFLSKQLMEKYGYGWPEVHAAWVHHDAEPQQTPEAIIVKAADAISASRPGARRESIEKYVARLQALESAAKSFKGVKNSYAISAGRELRVLIDPQILKDEDMRDLAENLAHKIEGEIAYPGKIKVNVIRRTASCEVVKT